MNANGQVHWAHPAYVKLDIKSNILPAIYIYIYVCNAGLSNIAPAQIFEDRQQNRRAQGSQTGRFSTESTILGQVEQRNSGKNAKSVADWPHLN